MADAAARFYQASHDRNLAARSGAPGAARISDPTHRYYAACRAIEQERPDRVLELGYGSPATVHAIAALGGFQYDITDIVDRLDRASLPANVRQTTCNLDDDFPFEDAVFDVVIALMIVEHLYDPFHAVAEIARVLKPGGTLVLNLPNIASLKCRLQLLAGKMPITSSADWFEKREWDGNHLHYFTVRDVTRLLKINGLAVSKVIPVGKGRGIKRLNPKLLCHEINYVVVKPDLSHSC